MKFIPSFETDKTNNYLVGLNCYVATPVAKKVAVFEVLLQSLTSRVSLQNQYESL